MESVFRVHKILISIFLLDNALVAPKTWSLILSPRNVFALSIILTIMGFDVSLVINIKYGIPKLECVNIVLGLLLYIKMESVLFAQLSPTGMQDLVSAWLVIKTLSIILFKEIANVPRNILSIMEFDVLLAQQTKSGILKQKLVNTAPHLLHSWKMDNALRAQ